MSVSAVPGSQSKKSGKNQKVGGGEGLGKVPSFKLRNLSMIPQSTFLYGESGNQTVSMYGAGSEGDPHPQVKRELERQRWNCKMQRGRSCHEH